MLLLDLASTTGQQVGWSIIQPNWRLVGDDKISHRLWSSFILPCHIRAQQKTFNFYGNRTLICIQTFFNNFQHNTPRGDWFLHDKQSTQCLAKSREMEKFAYLLLDYKSHTVYYKKNVNHDFISQTGLLHIQYNISEKQTRSYLCVFSVRCIYNGCATNFSQLFSMTIKCPETDFIRTNNILDE